MTTQQNTELSVLRFAAAVTLGVGLAALLLSSFWQRPVAGPGVQVAAKHAQAAPDTEIRQAPEALAGGVLQGGKWHFGYKPEPAKTKAFVASLDKPHLAQAGPELLAKARADKPVLLYRALYEAHAAAHAGEQWVVDAQGIGDCVSWGWAHASDTHLAVQWKLGDTAEWRPACTEAIYGGSRVEARGATRGGYSDGSYGAAAAKWTRDWGIIFRGPYEDLGLDLSTYSSSRAKDWGNYGCGGRNDKGRLDQLAKLHPARSVVLIRNFDEAAAAIAAGYPVPVCSGQGFSSRRDADGFSAASGSWAHCMCFVGVRFDRPGLLCLNSWGPDWIKGPKWPEDQPEGSFWVDARVATRMLAGEDSFSLSALEGFPHRDLRHGDWVLVEPAAVREYHVRLARQPEPREQFIDYTLAP